MKRNLVALKLEELLKESFNSSNSEIMSLVKSFPSAPSINSKNKRGKSLNSSNNQEYENAVCFKAAEFFKNRLDSILSHTKIVITN